MSREFVDAIVDGNNIGAEEVFKTENKLNYFTDRIYNGIEIVLDEPHAFLPLSKNRISEIKNSILQRNLEVSNLNANTVFGWSNNLSEKGFEPSLSNNDEKLRKCCY